MTGFLRHFLRLQPAIIAAGLALMGTARAADAHRWDYLDYPPLPMPGVPERSLSVLVSSGIGRGDGPSVLRFDLLWSARWDAKMPEVIADVRRIAVRLHLADGKVITLGADGPIPVPSSWTGAGSAGVTYSLMYGFPWGNRALEEAWVELTLPGQTYWIEIPYGFTANPVGPLTHDAEHSRPVFAPALKQLGEKDRIVPWLRVRYDLGEIQNHWRLSLTAANGAEAWADAILYRDDMRADGRLYLWERDTPRTTMELRRPGGEVVASRETVKRLHDDGMRRSDCYVLVRDALPAEGREWGKLVIKVADKEYECVVPSSIYKRDHGAADPANPKRLPGP